MDKPLSVFFTAIIASFLFVNSAFASKSSEENPVIASISKFKVTQKEADNAAKAIGIPNFETLPIESKKVIAIRLLNDKILENKAKNEELDESLEVQTQIRSILVREYLKKHFGSLEELAKKKYDDAVLTLKDKKIYTISHILVKEKSEASKLYKAITSSKNWKPEFKKLAKEKSIDTATAKNGGFVGSLSEIKLPEEFVKHIKGKKINTLIKPFQTNLGYHIVTLEKVAPMHIEPYESVKNAFIGQVFQAETERLAKVNLKDKEVKFAF